MTSMAGRKVPPEVEEVFEKYTEGKNVRRLPRDTAIQMLKSEFMLSEVRAEQFFNHFDADQNNIFSIWEFAHFYKVVGPKAPEMVTKFEELSEGQDIIAPEKVNDIVKSSKTADGGSLDEKEVELFTKTALMDNSGLTLGKYADLLARIGMYKKPAKK